MGQTLGDWALVPRMGDTGAHTLSRPTASTPHQLTLPGVVCLTVALTPAAFPLSLGCTGLGKRGRLRRTTGPLVRLGHVVAYTTELALGR